MVMDRDRLLVELAERLRKLEGFIDKITKLGGRTGGSSAGLCDVPRNPGCPA
jgi:hypothetical protein